jgi:hypothetical protein
MRVDIVVDPTCFSQVIAYLTKPNSCVLCHPEDR